MYDYRYTRMRMRVCVLARMRLFVASARSRSHVYPWVACAVHGRVIYSTKVRALPESLGQCKLLEFLCVRARRPAVLRVRGGAGAALLRVRCRV